MYRKFIIIYTANYCHKIKSFFDVDTLIQAGVEVEFWNLSKLTTNEYLAEVFSEGLIERNIESITSLEENIRKNKNIPCLFLSYISYAYYSYRVYKVLSNHDCDILYSSSGILPSLPVSYSVKFDKLRKPKSIANFLKSRMTTYLLKSKKFKPAKFVLMSCRNSTCDYKVSESTQYISCNSGDYNNFVHQSYQLKSDRIVFIDQYIPFHNDFRVRGLSQIPEGRYYQSLNHFFDYLESKYNCEVVICAHPSATLYRESNYFNGRKIVYNETALQVAQSIGVISHFSTAMSYAILFKKPILFITTDDIEHIYPYYSKKMNMYVNMLKSHLVNIDHFVDPIFENVDEVAYQDYIYGYLTTPKAQDKFNSDILLAIAKGEYENFKY